MTLVPILSIEPVNGGLRYRLDVPEGDLGEPLQEEFRHPIDDGTIQALLYGADALLRSAESPNFAREAEARGAVLYRTLVPARLRDQLKAVRGPLLIRTSLYGMPWELLHDEEEFWGLRYALGKRLVMARALPVGGNPPARERPRALVIGSDPRGDLPFVRHEVEAICETLEHFADVDCVTGRLATFDAVTAHLSAGFDLIHYCGHVVTDEGTAPALLLADERKLSATAIEANVTGRPLVFLNGCASARGGEHEAAGGWEASFSGVAYGFLFGGAVAVVGTLSDVSDRHAAALAEEFYRRALARVPIGEALRAAREWGRADPAVGLSPTWLSLVLHGNPSQVLIGEPGAPAERPRVVPAPERRQRAAPARAPRSALPTPVWLAFLLLLAAVVGGVVYYRQTRPPGPLIVGVMEVRSRGVPVPSWMRELTRDGLNTMLSKFDGLRVFSRQKIDFVRQKRNLTEIEAAEALGMSKMLSATVATDGTSVTLDLDIVDIGSGLLEASERVQGPQQRFMELQTDLALRALERLGVKPSPDEMKAIAASRANETLDAYRMLTDTLGEPTTGGEAEPPPPPAPSGSAPGTGWLDWNATAYAGQDDEEASIRSLLTRYGAALEAKDIDQLATLQIEMRDTQRTSLARYFASAGDLHVRISNVDVLIEGDDAIATFTREDVFTDARSGRPMRLEVRISGILVKDQAAWKIRGLRDPS
jgi:ketosteroid isomerase-like protein/TolB-like protein